MSITLRNIKGSPLTHEEMDENFSALTSSLGAGDGLTGGGFLTSEVEFNVGQGDGISVSPDSVGVNATVARTGSNVFVGDQTITGSVYLTGSLVQEGVINLLPTTSPLNTSDPQSFIYVTGSEGDLYFSQHSSRGVNTTKLRWLEGNLYSGILSGGVISGTPGGTTFNVSAGSGIIVEYNASISDVDLYPIITPVKWNDFTNITPTFLSSVDTTWLYIDKNGNLKQQGTAPTDAQLNSTISLGAIIHPNNSTINLFKTFPLTSYGLAQQTYEFIRIFGPIKKSGHVISPGAASLSLSRSSGKAFSLGRNYITDPNDPSLISDPAKTEATIYRYYQSGSEFVTVPNNTTIDPTKYNTPNTATGLSTVAGGQYTIQRVFYFPGETGILGVYYGRQQYNSISAAVENLNLEDFVEIDNTLQQAIFLGYVVVKGNATNLADSGQAEFIQSGNFRSTATSGGGGGTPILTTLNDLSDVTLGGLQSGDLLVYNGAEWENQKNDLQLTGSFSGSFAGVFTGKSATSTTGSFSKLNVTGDTTFDGDLVVTGRVTAEEFHTEFVSASIIYQSGSTKFGDTSDDIHSFTGSIKLLGDITGSSNIDIAGTVDANVYSINGTTVVDSSRNITGSNGLFTGDVDVANLDSSGNVDANTFSIDGSTVIDASENITGASLDVTGKVEGSIIAINGSTVIDSSENITGASLDVTGEVQGNSISIDGSTVIDSSENITGASLDVTGNADANTFSIDGSTVIDASENITGTSLDVTGEVQGNSVSIDGFTVIDSSVNITGSTLDMSGNIDGNSYSVNGTSIVTSGRVVNNITQANVDNLRLDGNTLSNTATDQNVVIEATGTGILDVNVGSNFQDLVTIQGDLYPETNYVSNIGAINKKFLTLSVAELIVETLVASERRTTVGGRFNVGIGTQLSQSLSSGDTTIIVENNNLNPNDIIHLEGGVLPKVEFMKVTSTASSGSGDGFSYTVIRDLDGSGANDWDAGSGVFNTGAPGNGFIDQYAINSLRSGSGISTAGPTIAFMERTGSAYQDIDIRAGVGNLKGWYGYSSEIFGFAAGDYRGQNITVDPENGLRIRDINTLQFQASGSTLTIGDNFIFNSGTGLLQVSGSNVQLETPTFFLGNSSQFISGSNGNLRVESTNFTIAQNGDVTMTGTITAEAGQIGGFAITDSAITGSGFFLSGSATGNEFFISSSKFNVKANGDVTASNATIVGDITATNITAINQGNIAGFTLTSNQLSDSGNNLVLKSNGQITGSNVLFTGGKISGSAIAFDVTNFVAKGDTVEISGSNFHLLNGNITASNVDLSGNINAQTGTIGGFNIDADLQASSGLLTLKGASGEITGSQVLFTGGKISGSNLEINVENFTALGNSVEISGSNFHLLNGNITASNVDLSGNINAQTGTIGGFTITEDALSSSNFFLSGSATGNEFFISASNFNVKANGDLTASNANITGDIVANNITATTAGNIAGWTVNADTFSSDGVNLSNATNQKGLYVSDGIINRFQAGDFLDVIPTGSAASEGTRTQAVSTGTKLSLNPFSPPSINLSGASTTADAGSITIPISSTVSQGDTVNVAQTIAYRYLLSSGITSVNEYASIEVRLVSGSTTVKSSTYARAAIYPSSKVVNLSYYYTGSANLSSGDLKVELIYSSSYERPTETAFFQEVFVSPTNITVDQARVNITDTQALFFQGPERYLEWTPENFTIKGGDASFGDIEVNDAIIKGDSIFSGSAIFLGQVTISGSLASHPVISPVASDVNNSGGTVIQDLDFDVFGHVQSVTSYNLDGRYYTETESDSRFVNVTGDTMTGALIVEGSGSTIFDVQGSLGQLFSVTDNLTGTLFSVNDISGIPILTVDSDDTITMGTFGADTLVVTGSNVGIGTTTPSSKLHVEGNTYLNPTSGPSLLLGRVAGEPSIKAQSDDGGNLVMQSHDANGSVYIQHYHAGNTYLATGGGNVGIGTTSPGVKLDILGGDLAVRTGGGSGASRAINIQGARNGLTANVSFSEINFNNVDNNASDTEYTGARVWAGNPSDDAGYLAFSTNDGSSLTERLRIDSSGNVGIGTTSPASKLTVAGNISGSGNIYSQGFVQADTFRGDQYPTNSFLKFNDDQTFAANMTTLGAIGAMNFIIDTNDNDSESFTWWHGNIDVDSATQLMDLDENGNLTVTGIITAQEFHTEFVSASIIYQSGSTKFGDTTDDVHAFTGSLRVTGSGDHYFSDGNVGIGETTPDSLLHLSGSSNNAILTLENNGNGNVSGINFVRERSTGPGVTGGSIFIESNTAHSHASMYLQTQTASADAGFTSALSDNNGVRVILGGGNGVGSFIVENGSSESFRINRDGNVGIGTTSPSTKLEVNGTATVTALVETSTRELKKDITKLEDQSSIVDSLQPVSYTWKESEKEDFGLIAEDVEEIAPHLVHRDLNGKPTGIKYSKLSVLLLDVVQRQSTLIEDLNKRITKLENERG